MLRVVGSEGAELGGRRAKLERAATLLVRDPRELYEVVVDRAQRTMDPLRRRPTLGVTPFGDVATGLDGTLAGRVSESLREDALAEIDAEVRERVGQLGTALPFPLEYNAASSLANLCYALVRALRPATVLETGVAYGVSSSFIAKALSVNGEGELHSVDRPAVQPGFEDCIRALVPDHSCSRWTLHRGNEQADAAAPLPEIGGSRSSSTTASTPTGRHAGPSNRHPTPDLPRGRAGRRHRRHARLRALGRATRPAFSAVVEEQWVGVAVL